MLVLLVIKLQIGITKIVVKFTKSVHKLHGKAGLQLISLRILCLSYHLPQSYTIPFFSFHLTFFSILFVFQFSSRFNFSVSMLLFSTFSQHSLFKAKSLHFPPHLHTLLSASLLAVMKPIPCALYSL